jgi:cobalt-zinc-cadmium efflux system protein
MSASDSHTDHPHEGEARLALAFALTGTALAAEAVGGWLAGSLALLADAGHLLVDAFALAAAWAGARFARRPADARRSFGYARLEVLVGYTNALAQLLLVAWIVIEALLRLHAPEPIRTTLMFAIAAAGAAINLAVLGALGRHAHDDVNRAGARLHVIGDLLGSLGAALGALLIAGLGWLWIDAAISLAVALLMSRSAWTLLRRSAHILLEGTPEGLETAAVAATLRAEAGVGDVHHVHVWQLAGGRRLATLHVRLGAHAEAATALATIQRVLRERFLIPHATIQIDHDDCAGAGCHEPAARDQTG